MRPVIDEKGFRIVDDGGRELPGLRRAVVKFDFQSGITVEAEFIAMQDGKPYRGVPSRDCPH